MTPLPRVNGGFRVVLADPPWSFNDKGTRIAPSYEGDQRTSPAPYQVMSLQDILDLKTEVQAASAPDSFLFLWAPGAIILEGTVVKVALAWGFAPKQILPWIKTSAAGNPRIGGGHYTRLTAEYMILCRRGKANVITHSEPDVIMAPRRHHSAKPVESYEKIERLCVGPYLEMFARSARSGWDVWGNEAPGEDPING